MIVRFAATTPSESTRQGPPRPPVFIIVGRNSRGTPQARPGRACASQAQRRGESPRPTDGPSTRAGSAPCRSSTASSAGSASARRWRHRLPREDRRWRVSNTTALLLLAKNLLVARAPLYGVGEWAARHEPSLARAFRKPTRRAQRRPRRPRPRQALRRRRPVAHTRHRRARRPRVRRRTRPASQRFHHRHLPRRLRLRRARRHPPRPAPNRHHLGPQQGPQARLETTALYSHSDRRRRRAGAVPGPERQHHRRPRAPRDLGLPPETHRAPPTSSTLPTASSPPPRTWPTSTRTAAGS